MRKLLAPALIVLLVYGYSAALGTTNGRSPATNDVTSFTQGVTRMFVEGMAGMARTIRTQQNIAPQVPRKLLTEQDVKSMTGSRSASVQCKVPIAEMEKALINEINSERAKARLSPLLEDNNLMSAARSRSQDQVTRNYDGHYDPNTGEALAYSLGAKSEVTAAVQRMSCSATQHAQVSVSLLMGSSSHRSVILDSSMTRIGAGAALRNGSILVSTVMFSN